MRARAQGERIGSLLVNPGGPGRPGPEWVRTMVLDDGVEPDGSPAQLSIDQYAAAQ